MRAQRITVGNTLVIEGFVDGCGIGIGDVHGAQGDGEVSITAIEMEDAYCKKLRSRGFGVACSMFEDLADADFPVADVYYWWPSDAGGQNEVWLWLIARALRKRRVQARSS